MSVQGSLQSMARGSEGWRRRSRAFIFVPLVAVLCLLGSEAQAVEVFFDPEIAYATYPEEFTVGIEVADLDSLRGFEVVVSYDSSLVEFVGALRGQLFADYTSPHGLYWSVDDQGDEVRIEGFIIPVDECVAAPGEILRLTFAAREAQGESPLHFEEAALRDCEGAPIPADVTRDGRFIANPAALLFFDPDPKYVLGDGYPCTISMEIDAVDSLRGFQVFLEYDNTKVVFDSALAGSLLTGDSEPSLWWYTVEESPTLLRIEGVLLGPGLCVDGPGELARLHFTSQVDFDSTEVLFETWHVWDVHTDPYDPVAVDPGLIIIDASWQDVPLNPGSDADLAGSGLLELRLIGPNPARIHRFEGVSLALRGAATSGTGAGGLWVHIFDVSGRCIWESVPRYDGQGEFRLTWSGQDASGAHVPAGVYLVRVRDARGHQDVRVVHLR